MNEELRKLIDEWHKSDRHQEIKDALEEIPEMYRDYETTGLLARAYNNMGDYAKAAELLDSVRVQGAYDALWNFRMGYAQYYMDKISDALRYFSKSNELNPGDEDTLFFIRQCNVEMPFDKRVDDFWNWFLRNEKELSEMPLPKSREEADACMDFIHRGTCLISENVNFNLGVDRKFSFSVEGWPDLFLLYPYVISRMPDSLKEKWTFFPFNQGSDRSFGFKMFGIDVDSSRIMVRVTPNNENGRFDIAYYEKTLKKLPEEKSDIVFLTVMEHTLGEGVTHHYINFVEPARRHTSDMIPLPELKGYIETCLNAQGKKFSENPKDLFNGYGLQNPDSSELRFDIVVGTTCLEPLLADFYRDSSKLFDHINSFGAQAVFISFVNGGDMDGNEILKFRHELEDRITSEILEPMNIGQIIGGATGTNRSYIDLIIFNLYDFIAALRPLLEQYPDYNFDLSDLRPHAGSTILTQANFKQSGNWKDNEYSSKDMKSSKNHPSDRRDSEKAFKDYE